MEVLNILEAWTSRHNINSWIFYFNYARTVVICLFTFIIKEKAKSDLFVYDGK